MGRFNNEIGIIQIIQFIMLTNCTIIIIFRSIIIIMIIIIVIYIISSIILH